MNDDELNRQLRAMVDGAAAPLSQAEVVLRASSPARKSRRDWHLTTHRLIVVAVAAVIVVVFFVPLPSLSLFNRLSHTGLSSEQSSTATIPTGWVPVTLGDARISVPASWWVLYNSPDCPRGKEPGEVLVNPTPTACSMPLPGDVPKNVIELDSFHGKHYGHLKVINGITVYWSGGNVYEVPLLGISIGITGPLGERVLNTLTRLPGPTVTTPAGWVPVAYGDAQISVPSDWTVEYEQACWSWRAPGTVEVGPGGNGYCPSNGGRAVPVVALGPRPALVKVTSGPRESVNGLTLIRYFHNAAETSYFVPSLDVTLTLMGEGAQRVIHTLTNSPRTVALAPGPAPTVPSSWQKVNLAGIDFSTPADWHILRTAYSEGIAFRTTSVTLSTDVKPLSFVSCSAPDRNLPKEPHNGIQIDQGAPNELIVPLAKKCLKLHGLITCPEGYPYSILVLRVTVPGRSTPAIVSIGLAGNGMIARTILYSLHPTGTNTSPVPTASQHEINALVSMEERASVQPFIATYRISQPVKGGWRTSTVFVAQRSRLILMNRDSTSLAKSRYEFEAVLSFNKAEASGTPEGLYTCTRLNTSVAWNCGDVGPGMTGSMLLSDYEPAFLAEEVRGLAQLSPPVRYPLARTVEGKELACLRFGSGALACLAANGMVAYFSTSVAFDNGFTGTVTLLSYSSHVPANAFALPGKPQPGK